MTGISKLAAIVISALAATFHPVATQAQDWPSRPVRIVVPFAAGGPADIYDFALRTTYATGIYTAARQPALAKAFATMLVGEASRGVRERGGFIVPA